MRVRRHRDLGGPVERGVVVPRWCNCMLLGPGLGYLDGRRLNKDLYTYVC